MNDFGHEILANLNYKGLTQKWLSEEIGVSTQYISDICAGRRTPSADVIERLAVAMEMTKDYVYLRCGKVSPDVARDFRICVDIARRIQELRAKGMMA